MPHTIRHAQAKDVPQIARIVNDYAERGQMLHRSHADLYERLRDFQVADQDGQVVGVVGLRVMWSNLAEVYALAVSPDFKGHGLGRSLVLHAVDEAEQLGIAKVFALTYVQGFFERCGFTVVDRQALPMKVWSECLQCSKRQACDEIAMLRILEDVPDLGNQPADSASLPLYEVPVPIERMRLDGSTADRPFIR